MQYIAQGALRAHYRTPRYRTEAAHKERTRLFVRFAKAAGVTRWEQVDLALVQSYAGYLEEQIEAGALALKTCVDRLSTVNVVLRAIRGDDRLTLSPAEHLGRRSTVRRIPPSGLDRDRVTALAKHLVEIGHPRVATVAELARSFGHRFREAALCPIHQAARQAETQGWIDIRRGTKGGRGKQVARLVPTDAAGLEVLLRAGQVPGLEENIIPADWDYARFYAYAHRVFALHAEGFGLTTFHDLRAAFACARYTALTGYDAPCMVGRRPAPRDVHRQAAEQLARELGHNRTDVLASYYGSAR